MKRTRFTLDGMERRETHSGDLRRERLIASGSVYCKTAVAGQPGPVRRCSTVCRRKPTLPVILARRSARSSILASGADCGVVRRGQRPHSSLCEKTRKCRRSGKPLTTKRISQSYPSLLYRCMSLPNHPQSLKLPSMTNDRRCVLATADKISCSRAASGCNILDAVLGSARRYCSRSGRARARESGSTQTKSLGSLIRLSRRSARKVWPLPAPIPLPKTMARSAPSETPKLAPSRANSPSSKERQWPFPMAHFGRPSLPLLPLLTILALFRNLAQHGLHNLILQHLTFPRGY